MEDVEYLTSGDITQSQFFDLLRSRADTGIKRLHLAVLERALSDVALWTGIAAESRHWLKSKQEAPFSFTAVCEALGLDADWMREGVARWLRGGARLARRSPVVSTVGKSLHEVYARHREATP